VAVVVELRQVAVVDLYQMAATEMAATEVARVGVVAVLSVVLRLCSVSICNLFMIYKDYISDK
jgi:hypothetical protein